MLSRAGSDGTPLTCPQRSEEKDLYGRLLSARSREERRAVPVCIRRPVFKYFNRDAGPGSQTQIRARKAKSPRNAWAPQIKSRQRPTLPRCHPRSTIGAERLNGRVRNGNGCGPLANITRKMSIPPGPSQDPRLRGRGSCALVRPVLGDITERVVCGVAERFRQRPVERCRGPTIWAYGDCSRPLAGWVFAVGRCRGSGRRPDALGMSSSGTGVCGNVGPIAG